MKASRVFRASLLVCGLVLTAACSAHNDAGTTSTSAAAPSAPAAAFTEGKEYVKLAPAKGTAAPTGALEVVEVFSYGCPHCAEFAPYMDKLRAELPKGTRVTYMPAVFNASWVPYAQAYYAARQLGVFEQTHDALFQAMLERYPLNSLDDLAAFYARHGVDQKKFIAAATDAETTRQMAADQKTEMSWGIDATPTLVVGRRASDAEDAPFVALMRSNTIDSYEQLQQVGLWMAQHAGKH
ncbi:MAG TPA: thiol:disulfide interchange protein DsbA/DsbL [Rhodanobacteraceae bacterium]|nr:thiol:disulfide interchange protein DsbA/DsbL [Rhodanobacteraceae bacterium]